MHWRDISTGRGNWWIAIANWIPMYGWRKCGNGGGSGGVGFSKKTWKGLPFPGCPNEQREGDMAILDIPKSPDALSAEWLTAALQSGGAGNARVASFEYEPIAAGGGLLGKPGRVCPRYARDDREVPRTPLV